MSNQIKSLDECSDRLGEAFRIDLFAKQADSATKLLSQHLEDSYSGDRKVWPTTSPEDLLVSWSRPDSAPLDSFDEIIERIIADSTTQHAPGFVGQQISMPPLVTAPTAMVSALLNNSSAIFEGAPVAIALEKHVIDWMCGLAGYDQNAGGVLTSGGTLGALTGLLAMRQAKMENDPWGNGTHAAGPVAVFVSEESHYCNRRACAVMGLGEKSAVPIATDDRFRMCLVDLEAKFAECVSNGIKPIAVVGNAGATATGSHDDLAALADFCERNELWFHVDGAHGGSGLLSPRLQTMLNGIERADSIVWDAHKMMLMPSLCTAVLVRNAKHLDAAFRQNAAYLLADGSPWHQPASRNFETTKPTMVLPLYVALRTLGVDFFRQVVEYSYDLAAAFVEELERRDAFEVLIRPQANIVCFRAVADQSGLDPGQLQNQLRDSVNRRGRFFIMRTTLRGEVWLRVVLMNPVTKFKHLCELLDELQQEMPSVIAHLRNSDDGTLISRE